MTKKAYITPVIEEMAGEPEILMFTASAGGEGISSDPNADTSNDDNRSRSGFNIWDDDDEF
jgi:hypothetical protein